VLRLIGVCNCHVPLAWFTGPSSSAGPAVVNVPALRKITPWVAEETFVTVSAPPRWERCWRPVAFVCPMVRLARLTLALKETVYVPEFVMNTESPATGTAFGAQLAAVVQAPLAVLVQTSVAARLGRLKVTRTATSVTIERNDFMQ
jgi:hypothetical protein